VYFESGSFRECGDYAYEIFEEYCKSHKNEMEQYERYYLDPIHDRPRRIWLEYWNQYFCEHKIVGLPNSGYIFLHDVLFNHKMYVTFETFYMSEKILDTPEKQIEFVKYFHSKLSGRNWFDFARRKKVYERESFRGSWFPLYKEEYYFDNYLEVRNCMSYWTNVFKYMCKEVHEPYLKNLFHQ